MSFYKVRTDIIHTDDKEVLLETAYEMGEFLTESKSEKQFIYVQTNPSSQYRNAFIEGYLSNEGRKEDISYFDTGNNDDCEEWGMCKSFPDTKIVIMDAVTLGGYYDYNQCSEVLYKIQVSNIDAAEIFIEDMYELYVTLSKYEKNTIQNNTSENAEYLRGIWEKCNYTDNSSKELIPAIKGATVKRNIIEHTKEHKLFEQGWELDSRERKLSAVNELKWNHIPEHDKDVMLRKSSSKEYMFNKVLDICKIEVERIYPGMEKDDIIADVIKRDKAFRVAMEERGFDSNTLVPAHGHADRVLFEIMRRCNIVALANIGHRDQTVCKDRWQAALMMIGGVGNKSIAYTPERKDKDDLPEFEKYINEFIDRCINNNKGDVSITECEYFIRTIQSYAEANLITRGYQEYLLQTIFGSKGQVEHIDVPFSYERWCIQYHEGTENAYAKYLINLSLCCSNIRSARMLWNALKEIAIKNPTASLNMRGAGTVPDYLYNKISEETREEYSKQSELEILMKNPQIQRLFMVEGYSTSFKDDECIICEPMLEIYKQALADEVGEYLLYRREMEVVTPKNAQKWMLSQYQLSSGEFIIFKNWKDSGKLKGEAVLDAIYEQMEKHDVDKVYVYNLIGDGEKSIHRNGEKTITVIEGMIDLKGNILEEVNDDSSI